MLTLGDTKAEKSIQRIAGFCPSSDDFSDLVNKACRIAMRRGDFPGTLQPIFACVRGGCVVWPRYVGNIRALGTCRGTVKVENMWGSYLSRDRHASWRVGNQWWGGGDLGRMMVNKGKTSVFQDVQGDGRLIRAYFRCNDDLGKTITIFGTDNNGQPLQTEQPDGTHTMGVVLTLASPFASTSTYVRSIDYVLLDEMKCPVNLYAYWAAQNILEDIAQYDPGETRPSFERTQIIMPSGHGLGSCSNQQCCTTASGVTALAKLRFIPAKYDTDLVLIDNVDALQMLIQSIKFREAGDRANAVGWEADAIRELNRQLEDESPDEQFLADNQIFSTASFQNQCF